MQGRGCSRTSFMLRFPSFYSNILNEVWHPALLSAGSTRDLLGNQPGSCRLRHCSRDPPPPARTCTTFQRLASRSVQIQTLPLFICFETDNMELSRLYIFYLSNQFPDVNINVKTYGTRRFNAAFTRAFQ